MTGVTVRLNRTNYSLYEVADRARLTATVLLQGATAGETVTVTIHHDTPIGPLVLVQDVVTVTAGHVTAGGFQWTRDLRTLVDANGIRVARVSQTLRDYTIRATPGVGASGEVQFTITLATVEEMRNRWCMGLPLHSVAFVMPREQPKAVTGVTVVSVGEGEIAKATAALVFDHVNGGPHRLQWAGGTHVTIPALGVSRLILTGEDPARYVTVEVDPTKLPGADVTETLILDYAPMTDDDVLNAVFDSYRDVQTYLQLFLEPTYVASRALVDATLMAPHGGVVSPVHEVGEPIAYYRPLSRATWLSVRLPYNNIHKVLELSGWFNQNRIVKFPDDLIVVTKKSGLVELIPTNQVAVSWHFYGPGHTYFWVYDHVANFWNYHAISGLNEVPPDIGSFIAKRAAVTMLITAGQALNPSGAASKSLSRDGVSEGSGLLPGGVYAATISQYLADTGRDPDGNENLLSQYRERYRGYIMVVL